MIEWAVSSSVLILLVLAVRALTKDHLSCRARYCLWLLVLVRLLVPMQLFTASWGLQAQELPFRYTMKSLGYQRYAELELPVNGFDENGKPVFESRGDQEQWNSFLNREPKGVPKGSSMEAGASADLAEAVWYDFRWSIADVLWAVWLAGAGMLAAVLLVSNLRFARSLRRTRIPYNALCGGVRVFVAAGLASPCLVGVFHPAVYLTPEATRDEQILRHVLAHETTHRLHGDCLWSLLRLAALCLHWYNPLVWLAVTLSKRDGELACDEATLVRLGEDERTAYGETLLSMVRSKPNARELLSASTAMTAGRRPMRERIETIARHPRTRALALMMALAVLLSASVFAFSRGEEREIAPMTEEEALDALEASVEWWEGASGVRYVAFTLPEAYERAEDWGIYVAGRAAYDDGMTMSRHYFEGEAWKAGGRYVIELSNLTELTMLAALVEQRGGLYERMIRLLPPGEGSSYAAQTTARWAADLDGDGTAEYIVTDASALIPGGAASIWLEDANGNELCDLGEVGLAHTAWRTLALTERDGKTYLLEYSPTMFQGEAAYSYTLMKLSGDTLAAVELQRTAFSANPDQSEENNAEAMRGFAEKANDVWQLSRLLFTTDQEVLAHLYDADTGKTVETGGRYYIADEDETIRYHETMYALLSAFPVAPSKAEVLALRERVETGMTDSEIKHLTEMVMVEHYWWEYRYLYEKTFEMMRDPHSLLWNLIDRPGDIQTGWTYGGDIDKDAVCAEEGLTEDEFYERYGQKINYPNNTHDAESFRKRITALKASVKSGLLDEDFDRLIALCDQAKETHDISYVIEMYHMLHDLDYYVLRYGPSAVGSRTAGPSIASNYYGCLSVWDN